MDEKQLLVNDRNALIDWSIKKNNHKKMTSRWHKGQRCTRLPNKKQLALLQIDAIGDGWMPKEALIFPYSRVVAVGSCFAAYFILWLADHGFNQSTPQSPYNALLRFGSEFENVAVIAQQFRWAFGELDEKSLLWISKNKEIFEATEERRQLVKNTLLNTDILLITLGLSEVWYDRDTGEPLWRAITSDQYDPEKHLFKVETMEQTLYWLNTIERLRDKYSPHMKIIFTVSPVRLTATFRPISALTANSVSKAILRAALDEFLRSHSEKLNKELFYFPSYECVTDYFMNPFEFDNRHVSSTVANNIIHYFVSYYCSANMIEKSNEVAINKEVSIQTPEEELLGRLTCLENKVSELQKICDERQVVITELDQALKHTLATHKDKIIRKCKFLLSKMLKKVNYT